MSKRQLTEAARAAKLIRGHLRKNGIKANVRSSNFSMGNSVTVKVSDLTPVALNAVQTYCAQYQYGHFDGMTDVYEYSNGNDDIAQAKYVSVSCEYSDTLRQPAWEWLCSHIDGMEDAPQSWEEARYFYNESEKYDGAMLLWHVLNGRRDYGFWASRKPRICAN